MGNCNICAAEDSNEDEIKKCCVGNLVSGDDQYPFWFGFKSGENKLGHLLKKEGNGQLFFKALALCNDCHVKKWIPKQETDKENRPVSVKERYKFTGSSKWDEMMTTAAMRAGVFLEENKVGKRVTVKSIKCFDKDEYWIVLRSSEYSYGRLRLTYIVQEVDEGGEKKGDIFVFTKSRESKFLGILNEEKCEESIIATQEFIQNISPNLHAVVAYKNLTEEEWENMRERLENAEEKVEEKQRQHARQKAFEDIECDMILLGCLEIPAVK